MTHDAPDVVPTPVTDDLAYLTIVFVNTYFVGAPGRPWALVDTGLPGSAAYVRRAAERRYGDAPPECIVLTHGHFDHAGNARALADAWDVPIYAHHLETPFLDGTSDYPPQDPTVGGAIAFLSRAFPHSGYDFGARLRALPVDGVVPGMPGWRWFHTPGHTPGHVSLWHDADRMLLAGDAFATMDLDAWTDQLTHRRTLASPPTPLTSDWPSALTSVERLATLEPHLIGAGHGRVLSEPGTAGRLRDFAARLTPPAHGRYVARPAAFDARGVVDVPPPEPDPLPRLALGLALGAAAGVALTALLRR